jgi:hypothetical protein
MNSFIYRFALAVVLIVLLVHPLASIADEDVDIEAKHSAFKQFEAQTFRPGISSTARGKMISDKFFELRFADTIKIKSNLSERDLDLLLDASETAFFYKPTSGSFGLISSTIDEFSARGVFSPKHFRILFDGLLVLRRFEEAASLLDRHPELNHDLTVPEVFEGPDQGTQGTQSRSVLAFNADDRTLEERRVSVDNKIVAIMQPQACQFSRVSLKEIEASPELKSGFEKSGLFLLPFSYPLQGGYLESLSDEFESTLVVPFDIGQWSDIEDWAFPTFYVYEGGKIVETHEGWTESTMARVLWYLRKWSDLPGAGA